MTSENQMNEPLGSNAITLAAFGYPGSDPAQPGLVALHAGAAYHRLATVMEVLRAYCDGAGLAVADLKYWEQLEGLLDGRSAWTSAAAQYRTAMDESPDLAEAWFNHARVLQAQAEPDAALTAFDRCVTLTPHPRAPAHALLHANAHWHAATLLEDAGRDDAAWHRYRLALERCDNFGVHHARLARFLRARGMIDESIAHFERLMTYSHRYFTEFVLPPLSVAPVAASVSDTDPIEVLYQTSRGESVVYRQGAYRRLPATGAIATGAYVDQLLAADPARAARAPSFLARLFGRRATPASRPTATASSIAELESSD